MEKEEFFDKFQYELESKMVNDHKKRMETNRIKGEEDGKRNLPSVDDQFVSPFEHETQNKYQSEIEELYQNGKQILDDLHDKQYKPVVSELKGLNEEKVRILLDNAESDKKRKLDELNTNHFDTIKDIENSPHYQIAVKRYEKIKNRWDEVRKKHNREELNIHFKPYWSYILLLIIIGIAEFPLNNQVFLSFRETPILTLIMSGVLVITLPFMAHASGKILKQSKERKIYPFLLVLLVTVTITISFLTSILRTNYVAELGAPDAELILDRWTFFTIGIILFLVGSIASFFAHDDSIEFSQVFNKFHKEEEIFLKVQLETSDKRAIEKDEFDLQRKAIQKEFSEMTQSLKSRIEYLKIKKTEISGNYNKVLTCFKGLERKINNYCQESIYHYRDTNLTYRNNHKQPNAWADKVPGLKCYFNIYDELNKS